MLRAGFELRLIPLLPWHQHASRFTTAGTRTTRRTRRGDVRLTPAERFRLPRHDEPEPSIYKLHRFPPSVIAQAVWLYFRFPLSLRLVEEMLLERGIVVSYDTIRCWAEKFGPAYAARLRRKAPSPSDVWHLDESVVTIGGRRHWLWRAVDQDGHAGRRTSIAQGLEQSRRELPSATAKTKASDAMLPIRWQTAAICLRVFSSQKSLRAATSETLNPSHPHSSHPRSGRL